MAKSGGILENFRAACVTLSVWRNCIGLTGVKADAGYGGGVGDVVYMYVTGLVTGISAVLSQCNGVTGHSEICDWVW